MALSKEDIQRWVSTLRSQPAEIRASLIQVLPVNDLVKILREFSEREQNDILNLLPNALAKEIREVLTERVEIPDPLIDEILRGNCVLFLGAGISSEVGMPSSKHLVRALGFEPRMLLDEAAQRFENEFGRSRLEQAIRQEFEVATRFLQPEKASHPFIANIPQLTSLIVTTNYDTLLEDALRREGKTPVTICREAELAAVTGQPHVIVKLHGDINQPETLVITQTDYAKLSRQLRDPGGFSSFLANLLTTRTVIFVGYSMKDEDFRLIRDFVAIRMVDIAGRRTMRTHYVVVPWGENEARVLETQTNIKVIQGPAQAFFAAVFRRTSEFLNRTRELRLICEVQQEPFVEIVGSAGSGKTMLLRGVETFYRIRRNFNLIIQITLEDEDSPERLLWRLAERYHVNVGAEEAGPSDEAVLRRRVQSLVQSLRSTSVLFTIDGTEKAPKLVDWLERELLPELRKMWDQRLGSGRVVFAGRQPFPWRTLTRLRLVSLELTPFEQQAVEEMVGKYFILLRKEVLSPLERKRISNAILQLTGTGHAGFIKAILEEITDTEKLPKDRYPSAADLVRYLEERSGALLEEKLLPLLKEGILQAAAPPIMQLLEDALCVFRGLNSSILRALPQKGLGRFGVDESRFAQPEQLLQDLKGLRILSDPSQESPLRRLDPVVSFLLSARLQRRKPELYRQAHQAAAEVFDEGIERADVHFRLTYALEALYHHQCLRRIDPQQEALVTRVKRYLEQLKSAEDLAELIIQWRAMVLNDVDLWRHVAEEAGARTEIAEQREALVAQVYEAVSAAFDESLAL